MEYATCAGVLYVKSPKQTYQSFFSKKYFGEGLETYRMTYRMIRNVRERHKTQVVQTGITGLLVFFHYQRLALTKLTLIRVHFFSRPLARSHGVLKKA